MSITRATARRVVRTLAARNVDWNSPVFKQGDHDLAAKVNQFRSWVDGAKTMAEKYSAPPTPVDFAAAKETIRDKELVDALEKLYNSSSPPPEVHVWSEEEKAAKQKMIEDAKASLALTQEMIVDTEKEIAFLEANRTTRETSATELAEIYPEIAEEIENEIENREWFKDTVAK